MLHRHADDRPRPPRIHAVNALRITAIVFSLLVLGAHFLRGGNIALCAVCVGLIGLLRVRRPWARRTLQVVLGLGAVEWIRLTFEIAEVRVRAGEPWERMAVILVAVAAVAALAVAGLESKAMRGRFEPRA